MNTPCAADMATSKCTPTCSLHHVTVKNGVNYGIT